MVDPRGLGREVVVARTYYPDGQFMNPGQRAVDLVVGGQSAAETVYEKGRWTRTTTFSNAKWVQIKSTEPIKIDASGKPDITEFNKRVARNIDKALEKLVVELDSPQAKARILNPGGYRAVTALEKPAAFEVHVEATGMQKLSPVEQLQINTSADAAVKDLAGRGA